MMAGKMDRRIGDAAPVERCEERPEPFRMLIENGEFGRHLCPFAWRAGNGPQAGVSAASLMPRQTRNA